MTKIYITIISLVTVVAIMFGCFIHIFNKGHFTWNVGSSRSESDTVTLTGDVDTIEVDTNYAGLTIKYGDDVHVEYTLPESLVPDISLKNGVLSVVTKNTIHIGNAGWNDFSITIVIPEGTELDDLKIDLDAGNVKVADIAVKDVNVRCDAGNIELKRIEAESFDLNVDAGNIELTDITTDKVTVKADAGNIEFTDCTIDVLNADADAGNIESHNCTINSGEVRTDLGNIHLRGDIGDVDTHTSLGNVRVDD